MGGPRADEPVGSPDVVTGRVPVVASSGCARLRAHGDQLEQVGGDGWAVSPA